MLIKYQNKSNNGFKKTMKLNLKFKKIMVSLENIIILNYYNTSIFKLNRNTH